MITIFGQPISKKNSINLVDIGKPCSCCGRKPRSIPLPSKAFKAYEKAANAQLRLTSHRYRGKIEIAAKYYLKTLRMPDLNNLLAATADILQAAGIIQDDKDIVSWDGSRIIGKDPNPRVEITITEIKS
jgi:Holliday junction resolvase RusA-like endonuclease